jgi:thymidine kinase
VVEGAQTEIGGNDRYVAMCRRHFMEARRRHFMEARRDAS